MPRIRFGAVAQVSDVQAAARLYEYLDSSGFAVLWVPDSQSLMHEMTASMAIAAARTSRIQVHGGVTNPLTRHPAVQASALSTVDEFSGGRAAVTISTGDSAVYNLGLKPATLAAVSAYVTAMRELWARGETEYQGRTIRLLWPSRPSPIYMAAEGPRSLRLAGRIADGVVVGMGLTREAVQGSLGYLEEGLSESNRTMDDIDIWWMAKWNIGESREAAVHEIRMGLAASCNHAFRFSLDGKFVPAEYHDAIRQLQAEYAFEEHEKHGATRLNAELPDRLGLTKYLAQRFAIVGTVRDFIERCEDLADLGIRQIRLSATGQDRARLLRKVAEEVIPHFR